MKKRDIAKAVVIILLIVFAAYYQTTDDFKRKKFWDSQKAPTKEFSPAADGDVSSESITSFSETLPDDTLFYPDAFFNETAHVADQGYNYGDWTKSQVKDGTSVIVTSANILYLDFVSTTPTEYVDVNIYGTENGGAAYIYDWDTSSYTDTGFAYLTYSWGNYTFYGEYVNSTYGVKMKFAAGGAGLFGLDYVEVKWYYMTLEDSDHYAESFAGVDDWTQATGGTWGTDGDVAYFDVPNDASSDSYYTNVPSISSGLNYYYEFRIRKNTTYVSTPISLWVFSSDGGTGDYFWSGNKNGANSWITYKGIITTSYSIESVKILFTVSVESGAGVRFYLDYLRIGPANEMGWQHDASTTEGTTPHGSMSISSDGDYWNVSVSSTYDYFTLNFDTTATAASINPNYYPFLHVSFNASSLGSHFAIYAPSLTIQTDTEITKTDYYYNLRALTSSDIASCDIYAFATHGPYLIDFVKFYSIANWTITQGAGQTSNDILYVSNNVLYAEADSGSFFTVSHDPTISVAQATYPVWNITTSNIGAAFVLALKTGSWNTFSDEETRGAVPSDTVVDIYFQTYVDCNVAAIKFIEDATAPNILDKYATPANPTPTDAVTISVVATDSLFIYEVTINAVTYPAGFSDVDYTCTEEVSQNVYTYTFSSLTEGYYLFAITVSDGANTDVEYLPVSTATVPLQISDIVLITATENLAQISGHSNKDCSYHIYENNSLQGSGSISTGWFSVSWAKDSTPGAYIVLGVEFYTGTYTEWVNGSYSVASAEVLQVTDTQTTQGTSTVQLSGYVNLAATYTIYEDDVQTGTGSLSAGSFSISWTRQSSTVAADIVYGVKFTDGTTTRWVNGTYSKALETAFKVSTWWLDLDLGGKQPMVQGYVSTTWENATIKVYDNGTLQLTVTESEGGVFFYWWMSEVQGIHNIVLNITSGATTYTRTRSYFIPDWAVTGLVGRYDIWNMQNNATAMSLESNWGNTTVSVYLNSSLVATSGDDPAYVNFTRSSNVGTWNLTISWNGGTQTYTITNIRFTVTEQGTTYVSGGFQEVHYNYTTNYYTNQQENNDVQLVIGLAVSLLSAVFLTGLIMWWKDRDKKEQEYRLAVASGGSRTQ